MKKLTCLLALLLIFTAAACGKPADKDRVSENKVSTEFASTDKNKVLYDKDDIKVTFLEMAEDEYSYTVKLSYDNKTDKKYDIQTRNVKINGKDTNSIGFSDEIAPSTVTEGDGIGIYKAELQKETIEKPESLKGDFVLIYNNTEEARKFPFTINFK